MKKLNCILLIDDDDITNFYNRAIINSTGIARQIYTVTDGKQGLDYITRQGKYESNDEPYPSPEAIFLDINMPGMNGFEFLEGYHDLDESIIEYSKIFMLTTSFLEKDRERALSFSNVEDFFNKPLTEQNLIDLMNKYFNQNHHSSLDSKTQ
ncbi:response regulator [Reichenbachiella versicolor]|uniref:response regulator n=1 Tax=Reichenbachiella versicolor TaxID=1821036 RepID=UPI000D6E4326|nr:response regulator [Reichenbachiella versicolor]